MKKIYFMMLVIFFSIVFNACSDKKPSEPYYDRAQNASQKAHTQLDKD